MEIWYADSHFYTLHFLNIFKSVIIEVVNVYAPLFLACLPNKIFCLFSAHISYLEEKSFI